MWIRRAVVGVASASLVGVGLVALPSPVLASVADCSTSGITSGTASDVSASTSYITSGGQSTAVCTLVFNGRAAGTSGGANTFAWTVPVGVTSLDILAIGGGGGGGLTTSEGVGGGGGGGQVTLKAAVVTTAGSLNVSVGDGGPGGVNLVQAQGYQGTSTTVGGTITQITASGGLGGPGGSDRVGEAVGGDGGAYTAATGESLNLSNRAGGSAARGGRSDIQPSPPWAQLVWEMMGAGGGAGAAGDGFSGSTPTLIYARAGDGGNGLTTVTAAGTLFANGYSSGGIAGGGGGAALAFSDKSAVNGTNAYGGGIGASLGGLSTSVATSSTQGGSSTGGGGGGGVRIYISQVEKLFNAAQGGSGRVVIRFVAAQGPTVTTGTAASVTSTTATLNATVAANGLPSVVSSFKYATTLGGVDSATPQAATAPGLGAIDLPITGLAPGTTYYFNAYSSDSSYTLNSSGTAGSFTTDAAAPSVTTGAATSVASTTATLPGTVNANGAATSALTIKYSATQADVDAGGGTAATVSPTSATGAGDTSVSAAVTGLSAGTTYYYRVSATNSVGTTNGSTRSFTPLDAPSVTTGAATSVAATSATLPGTVNAKGAATSALTIKYSTTQADVDAGGGTSATVSPASATGGSDTSVSAAVTGLSASTTYYYRASATNSVGTTNGSTRSFTTTASGGGGGGTSTPSTDTPTTTTTTPTTPTTVTPAAPSPLGPEEGLPVTTLTPGGTTVATGGQPTPVTTVPNKAGGTVTSSGDDWSLTTGGRTPAGKSQPTSPTGVVQVPQGGSVVVSGKGYEPGTSVQVYAMNPALLLGTFTVGADGTFRDSVTWPAGLATGAGVLQVNGFCTSGAVRSYSLGIGVIKDASGKVRTVERTVYFAAGSSWLSPTAKAALAKTVASVPKGATLVSVVATGYVQGTRDRSNDFTLSTARATKAAAQMKADKLVGKYYVTGRGVAKESGALGRKVIVMVTYR